MRSRKMLIVPLVALALAGPTARGADDAQVQALIEKVKSENIEARYAARSEAPAVGAKAVVALAGLIDETAQPAAGDANVQRYRREVALTARAALERLVHHAGRPGADAERQAVAAELAGVIGPGATTKTKREVLHLIAFIGADAEAPSVKRLLSDEDANVRETARLALERMEGPATTLALIEAAKGLAEEQRPDILVSLGKKGDRAAVPVLLEYGAKAQGRVRLAALAALAHLAAEEAIPVFEQIAADKGIAERAQVFSEYLRLADNLADADKRPVARAIYVAALRDAPAEHQRERALYRLTLGGGDLAAILAGLSDPGERVRALALRQMEGMRSEAVLDTLLKAYGQGNAEGKTVLLRVIADRSKEAAAPLLEEAVRGSSPELKLTALDIQGRLDAPELEATYLQVAQTGSPSVRPVALKGYLILAQKSLDAGTKEKALAMFGKALELAPIPEQRLAALQGLTAVGDPAGLDRVWPFLKDAALANEVARAVITLSAKLGAAGDKDKAEGNLMQIVTGEFPKELRNQAAEELTKMGRDPRSGVRNQGFVVDWWLLTPIQDPDGTGLSKEHFPEKVIDLVNEQRVEGRKFRWQKLTEVSLDGRINLLTSFRRSDKVLTYAYTEIEAPSAMDALFKMGSDDGIACWLNGERIHIADQPRGLVVDQDVVKAKLQAGKNKILLKISNGGGDWGFAFRTTDGDGKPLSFRVVN